ncbi:putative hydrolase [Mycobacterium kansasii]|uniref:Putative hydrolase n=1 Tax=Mycobacterium kansasii TaxID=1768 RepID=A0A1V3WRQ4_MYCKA|nr:putative hydrolase [Mycobacterium kansasii]
MASSDLGDLGTSNRITGADLESVAANASAERALDGMRATAATQDRPQPPIDLTAAAFFDVDNTLVQGSSAVHFGRGWPPSLFTYRDVLGFVYAQAKFQLLGVENSDDVAAGGVSAGLHRGPFGGRTGEPGRGHLRRFIADKIWPGTRELTQMHLDAVSRFG